MNKLIITNEKIAETGDLYGIFFEDLNHAADGGLYAEMVRNRSFEFSPIDNPSYSGLTAWQEYEPEGTNVSLSISDRNPVSENNPHYLIMQVITDGTVCGVKNEGFNSGLPVHGGEEYRLSIRAKAAAGETVTISLVNADNEVYDSVCFTLTDKWENYSSILKSTADDFSARLLISMNKSGKVYFDFVSLFHKNT